MVTGIGVQWEYIVKKADGSVLNMNVAFIGRHQAAVCELEGFMYVIGGAESWNCLNSVERYNPENNTWTLVAPMNIARRGAGVAVHEGKQSKRQQFISQGIYRVLSALSIVTHVCSLR